jgi:hypothetical protein
MTRSTWMLALAAIVVFCDAAHAHFALLNPPSATAIEDGGKGAPPCGEGLASNIVTPVQGGHPLKIQLNEFVFHPGHYRIALSVHSRDELPPDPDVLTSEGLSISAAIQNPPQIPVLADGVFLHTGSGVLDWETDVVLPNINCEKCTLQIIEFMAEHAFNLGGGYFYHHCADLRITADPSLEPADAGWMLNPVGPSATVRQYLAQIAAGSGMNSSIVLINPSRSKTASGSISFFDDQGQPLGFPLTGESSASTRSFAIKPLGSVTFTANNTGQALSGSAISVANLQLAAAVKLSAPGFGPADLGESIPLTAAITPVVRNAERGLNTGIAIRNTQATEVDVSLVLRTLDGQQVPSGAGSLHLGPNGHAAKFVDEIFPAAATSDFVGMLVVQSATSQAKVALNALELGRAAGEFAVLPVAALDPPSQPRQLFFPQVGNGASFSSSIWLMNPSGSYTGGEMRFFDDDGNPLTTVAFNVPPQGAIIVTPDAKASAARWAQATSEGALAGGVVVTHPQSGLAGMSAASSGRAFITSVSRKPAEGRSTGLAIAALGSDVTLALVVRTKTGETVPGGTTLLPLRANGHLSRFIEELFPNAFTDDFEGAVTIEAEGGNVAVTALDIDSRSGGLSPLPVTPVIE